MNHQVSVDVPHTLGAAEAKRRIEANLSGLTDRLPAGATVRSQWEDDSLRLNLSVLAQPVEAQLDIGDTAVRVTVLLPPALAFFANGLTKVLRQAGTALLEDRTKA